MLTVLFRGHFFNLLRVRFVNVVLVLITSLLSLDFMVLARVISVSILMFLVFAFYRGRCNSDQTMLCIFAKQKKTSLLCRFAFGNSLCEFRFVMLAILFVVLILNLLKVHFVHVLVILLFLHRRVSTKFKVLKSGRFLPEDQAKLTGGKYASSLGEACLD